MLMYHDSFITDEQREYIRVCVENAPIPYDITKKKIPVANLDKICHSIKEKQEGETLVKCDLSIYE